MKKVLLVEDDKMLSDLYVEILKDGNYQVKCAYDGEKAYKEIKKGDFDLLLLDIMLPKLDGVEILKKLKKEEALPKDQPIILLTNLSEEAVVKKGELEVDEYIIKSSITPDVLLDKVNKHLKK